MKFESLWKAPPGGGFTVHFAAALATTAAVRIVFREYSYKLADQVLVFADAAGFAETAAEHPFGFLDWCARLLAATGLTGFGWLVDLALVAGAALLAHRALRGRLPALAAWLPAFLFAVPLSGLGEEVWLLKSPHFPQLHLLWFALLAAFARFGRAGLAAFAAALVAALGVGRWGYDCLPVEETLSQAFCLPPGFTWSFQYGVSAAVFAVLALAALLPAPPDRLRALLEKRPLRRLAPFAVPALFAAVFALNLPGRDCRDQLAMERAAREARFEDLLAIAPKKARPERMETAWRILAMYRLDRLDRDLYRYPIVGSHQNTEEEEMIMEGPLYLFNFGLILPARRWIFESVMVKGWQPQFYRLLGDTALITGEEALARKNFRQLARCPFRGDFAAKRLETLGRKPLPPDAFADLADVAGMYDVWRAFTEGEDAPLYFGNDRVVERFTYTLFLQLKSCPPPMLKMFFASALLEGRKDLLKDNSAAIAKLYPDGRIGPVFLEALK